MLAGLLVLGAAANVAAQPGKQILVLQSFHRGNLVLDNAMAVTPRARRHVTIRTEVRAGDVELSVSDSGTGLPEELDGNLFTPFVTTKAHGLGIGLTIARTIVDAHGGTIDARNNPEGGATFTVTLLRGDTSGLLAASAN